MIDEEATAEGLHMTLLASTQSVLMRWLLGWGADVRVLEPDWLREGLIEHAERMLRNYRATLDYE